MGNKTISAPLYIELGVKKIKRYYINLNQYRNWCFQVSNNIKKRYKQKIYTQVKDLKLTRITLIFTLWKKDRRKIDRANVLSIHEKFFCDALVESGCIPDDNDNYIKKTVYKTGGIDKLDPRVEIEIIEEKE